MSGGHLSDSGQNSITQWFDGLRAGEADAVRQLWERYSTALITAAKIKLGSSPRQALDEEDVVISVFLALCRGAEAGRFNDIRGRDDLWWLLLSMTHRKAISQIRHETADKRGGWNRGPSLNGDDSKAETQIAYEALISDEPTPEYLAIMQEEHARLLGLLRNDVLRQVASLRLEGYTVREVAEKLKIGTRAVERKMKLIRQTWSETQSE